jgi:hypothetical protein
MTPKFECLTFCKNGGLKRYRILGKEITMHKGAKVDGGDGGLDNGRARLQDMVSEVSIYSQG